MTTTIADSLLHEFRAEAKTTRIFLERLPEDKLMWQPHLKSMTAGQLAWHIAELPISTLKVSLVNPATFDIDAAVHNQPKSMKELMDRFQEGCDLMDEKMPTISDEQMKGTWTCTVGGNSSTTLLMYQFRTSLLNHLYHHRGQFGVYLRLVGVKVPPSYGPSADEKPDWAPKLGSPA